MQRRVPREGVRPRRPRLVPVHVEGNLVRPERLGREVVEILRRERVRPLLGVQVRDVVEHGQGTRRGGSDARLSACVVLNAKSEGNVLEREAGVGIGKLLAFKAGSVLCCSSQGKP